MSETETKGTLISILRKDPRTWTSEEAQYMISLALLTYHRVAPLFRGQHDDDAVVATLGTLVITAAPRVDEEQLMPWDEIVESFIELLQ